MNTERRRSNEAPFNTSAIERVREGMTVIDAAGETLGTVEYVQMGDPDAATTHGSTQTPLGSQLPKSVISGATEPFFGDEPEVPEPVRSQLIRHGFIKVDNPGLLGSDRYVRGDHIREVSNDKVILKLTRDQLPTEA